MSASQFLVQSVNDAYENRINRWGNSPFEKLTLLSNDERGKWGERVVFNLIQKLTTLEVVWDEDHNINNEDGVYDIAITHNGVKYRIEVKTATRGNGEAPNWQHENIYSSHKWDKLILFDVDFYGGFITIIDYEDMIFGDKHPIFNRKVTLRKEQVDKYKFDFGIKQQVNGISNGMTFRYNLNNFDEDKLSRFLVEKLT